MNSRTKKMRQNKR